MNNLRWTPVVHFFGTALLFFVLSLDPGLAQTWPQRPVKFVVTLGAGSGVDFGARILADQLSKKWGQPVVVENRPGGDAVVAINAVLSANDDHVLLASPSSALIGHPYMLEKMPYKSTDLLPIARGWNVLLVIAVPTPLPVKTLAELVAMSRANPGKLNWAGTTGAIDFLFAGFLKKQNLQMERVPYRNPQDAARDLVSQRIQVADASLATVRAPVQAGTVKLLAVTNSTRSPAHPDLPTVQEAGFPELTLDGLVGLFGNGGMSLKLREQIAADVREIVAHPDFGQKLSTTGQMANAGGPSEFEAAIKDQRDRLAIAAKDLGLKAAE